MQKLFGMAAVAAVVLAAFAGVASASHNGTDCPHSHGFWKRNVANDESLVLGDETYTASQLRDLLKRSTKGDASIELARQLVAAKLNAEDSLVEHPDVTQAIADADAEFTALSPGSERLPFGVRDSSDPTLAAALRDLAHTLDLYNNGGYTEGCTETSVSKAGTFTPAVPDNPDTPDVDESQPAHVVFEVVVSAAGPGPSVGVALEDQLPSGTWTLTAPAGAGCAIDGANLLTCAIGDMAAGSSVTITVERDLAAEECGTIENTATVDATVDTDATNNEATDSVDVGACAV